MSVSPSSTIAPTKKMKVAESPGGRTDGGRGPVSLEEKFGLTMSADGPRVEEPGASTSPFEEAETLMMGTVTSESPTLVTVTSRKPLQPNRMEGGPVAVTVT